MKSAPAAVLAVVALAATGCAGGHPSRPPARARPGAAVSRPSDPLTKTVVACERAGKLVCDRAAYRKDRAEGPLPLSKPDPPRARLLTLQRVLPPAWRGGRYGAELMTYGRASKIAPGLAGMSSAVVDPRRKVWVLTIYYDHPKTVPFTGSEPPGVARTIRMRSASETTDALTGDAIDSCVNCTAVPAATTMERAIRAARKSNPRLFSIFPGYAGARRCAIPEGGMTWHRLRGTCRTRVFYPPTHGRYREAFVDLREGWGRRHATWTVIVQLPAEKVVATEVHGTPAPQYRY